MRVRPKRSGLEFLLVLLMTVLCSKAEAVVLKRYTLSTLSEQADDILHVTCVAAYPGRSEGGSKVYTYYKFEIRERLRGGQTRGDGLMLRLLGGSLGGQNVLLPGAPSFREGNHYLLYLKGSNDEGYPLLVGFSQGVVPLQRSDTGVWQIQRSDLSGLLENNQFGALTTIPLELFRSTLLGGSSPIVP